MLKEPVIRPRTEIPRKAERPDWAKNLVKAMDQMKMQMKEKGMDAPLDYTNLDLYKGSDPLPRKFKFPDMKKYSGTEDPHLHLKQYVTYLSATELTNAQIVKQFPLSLEGAPIHWYYNLESSVQADWKELYVAFIQQYGLNTPMDVSLRDLQNVNQKFNESFSEYLTRWRVLGKLESKRIGK